MQLRSYCRRVEPSLSLSVQGPECLREAIRNLSSRTCAQVGYLFPYVLEVDMFGHTRHDHVMTMQHVGDGTTFIAIQAEEHFRYLWGRVAPSLSVLSHSYVTGIGHGPGLMHPVC